MPPRTSIGQRPTHHVILTDGVESLGLTLCDPRGNADPRAIQQSPMPKTSLQTSQGDPDYGTLKLPYVSATHKSWEGGRGWTDFSKDSTRYFDSESIDTRYGDVILGPKPTIAHGGYQTGGQPTWTNLDAAVTAGSTMSQEITSHYIAAAPLTWRSITVRVQLTNSGPDITWGRIRVNVYGDNGANQPNGVVLAASDEVYVEGTDAVSITMPILLETTAGQKVWPAVQLTTDDTRISMRVAYRTGWGGYNVLRLIGGAVDSTLVANASIYFSTTNAGRGAVKFFEYQDTMLCIINPLDGTAPRLMQNGYTGIAKPNTGQLTKLLTDFDLSYVGSLTGVKVKIVAGPGRHEWRTITANTNLQSGNVITVDAPWDTVHTTATRWALIGTTFWVPAGGTHGLTKRVTDILVVDDILYFAQGEGTPIRRGKRKPDATWETWAADGTNDATFLELIQATDGKRQIWRALANASTVNRSDVKPWGTNLNFGIDVKGTFTAGTFITCDSTSRPITNMIGYGQPQCPWVMKEDCFGSIQNDIFSPVHLAEYRHARSWNNGRAATSFGVYLFFSMRHGFERFYDNRLDDLGPNLDEGLPAGRQFPIIAAIPVPGGILVAIDGGANGQSSILQWNQIGWHELYRSGIGKRITHMAIQEIPGDSGDRLWFNLNEELWWIPFSTAPRSQDDYIHALSGSLITPWYRTGFSGVNKFWRSLTLYTDGLGIGTVTAYYQVDGESDWTALPGVFNQSPEQELPISNAYDVTGKRIRFKLVLATGNQAVTPRIIAYNIASVVRVPPADSWSVSVLAAKYMQNQQGRWEQISEADLRAKLAVWANSNTRAAPIIMQMPDQQDIRVFIDPATIVPIEITVEAQGQVRTKKVLSFGLVGVEEVAP